MIAKLASSSAHNSSTSTTTSSRVFSLTSSSVTSSSLNSKRKRAKLLDLLLTTNWTKQSQQANNLIKLNKLLLVCDVNFLDEKTGESPLILAISSAQISAASNHTQTNANTFANRLQWTQTSIGGCPQSISLFNLQSHSAASAQVSSASHNQQTLQQTSTVDICQSQAPLVERIILLLIKSGAQIDFCTGEGRTALHVAAIKSNFWALKTLLELGASTDSRDSNGLTPLYYSILHRAELKITQLLLSYAQSRSASANNGFTSDQAAGATTTTTTTLACIRIIDQHGWQEVHHASKLGLDAHLDKLLYYGCDMNAKITGSGNTPLHVAAINDQLDCAKVLLLRGADMTITNNSHQTAHQVAVISNNLDLAEFIAEHDETRIIPFNERPIHAISPHNSKLLSNLRNGSRNSQVLSNHSAVAAAPPPPPPPEAPAAVQMDRNSFSLDRSGSTCQKNQPQPAEGISERHSQFGNTAPSEAGKSFRQDGRFNNPLTLDVVPSHSDANSVTSSAPTSLGGTSQSLLSINSTQNHTMHAQGTNISPCLSQRSCATSNTTTTSSSGVCCDGDGRCSTDDMVHSQSRHSNITVISVTARKEADSCQNAVSVDDASDQMIENSLSAMQITANRALEMQNGFNEEDEEDLMSESSCDGLQSLISDERPLFVGSFVLSTSDYQSGDPNHLQLHRGDLIEVLEYPERILQDGQLPRLANKAMLFGRRQSDQATGLFPSFCVRRTRHGQASSLRQRNAMKNLTNTNHHQKSLPSPSLRTNFSSSSSNTEANNRLIESQSMVAISDQLSRQTGSVAKNSIQYTTANDVQQPRPRFREFEVVLTKLNEGFGFVLRGAKMNLPGQALKSEGHENISINENLVLSNNLASLQYLDDIEAGSVADKAGLRRGDFLVAVNRKDVRFLSHEHVVQTIRQSGDRVHLRIATPMITDDHLYASRTLNKQKPEPPKRDPTTTLTRNKTQRVKSMPIQPQLQQQQTNADQADQFDANKPLPRAPISSISNSPTGSLNLINRSISANLSHFNSAQSLSSGAPDTQSISSLSTVGSSEQNQSNQQSLSSPLGHAVSMNHSSSSTTTLTTVATRKPRAPAKPSDIHQKLATSISPAYQPAIITTNKRNEPIDISSQPEHVTVPAEIKKHAQSVQLNQKTRGSVPSSVAPMPPPPPPPPPTFDPSITPTKERLNNRRISAPISANDVIAARNSLLKKQDSAESNPGHKAQVVSHIGSVAAACAAAANNRLLRQQQQSMDRVESNSSLAHPEDGLNKDVLNDNVPESSKENMTRSQKKENMSANQVVQTNKTEQCKKTDLAKEDIKGQSSHKMSATLGRRSSAMIIQQPKVANGAVNHSQTLKMRSKQQRPSIPTFDDLPPPPSPLPMATIQQVAPQTQRDHNGNIHQHRSHQPMRQPASCPLHHTNEIELKRYQRQLIEQHQMLQQQYILQQQQRQQQQQQQQQQQLRARQQARVQPSQRPCQCSRPDHGHPSSRQVPVAIEFEAPVDTMSVAQWNWYVSQGAMGAAVPATHNHQRVMRYSTGPFHQNERGAVARAEDLMGQWRGSCGPVEHSDC